MTGQIAEVRFGRLERRGLLLGLSPAQLALTGTALVVLVASGMTAGPVGILVGAPAWAGLLVVALAPVGGRPLVESLPVVVPWAARRLFRRHVALRSPGALPVLSIPGVPGRLRITADAATGAALIRPGRGRGAVTVVARLRGRGFLLEDATTQQHRVAGWGRLLGSLGQLPHVTGAQVLHRACGDGGRDVQQWWAAQAGTGAWAEHVLTSLVDDAGGSSRVESLLAITLRPRRDVEIGSALRSLADAVRAADLDLDVWLTPRQAATVIRQAYDPAADPDSTDVAPMGVVEQWSHARSDSGFHATFWISEWPRYATQPGFLRSLLLAPGAHRTFSLTAEPLPSGKALREIRRARAEQLADAATRARVGQVEDEAARAAAAELTRREEDLIAGHGDLRFTGLIAVTASNPEELEDACASLQASAGQAGCELRRLVGQQVQAFAAAALPLGRVMA